MLFRSTDYKGWLGAFGRWYCGVNAAVMFEQAWAKDWKNTRDEKVVATALGDFRCSFGEDGVKVLSGPTPMPKCRPLRPDTPPPAPPKTRQQAIEDRFMENQSKSKADGLRQVFTSDPVTFSELLTVVRECKGTVVIVDGELISIPFVNSAAHLSDFYKANKRTTLDELSREFAAKQVECRLDSIYLDHINGVWEWHTAFVPRTEAEVVEPADKFTDELVSSKLNIHDLCRVMELAFDKAGPDRDYSVVMKYKQAGDLATANIKLEVLGVHQVTNNVSIDLKADSPEQVARDFAAMMADKGSPDVVEPGPDLGYGSEFDHTMMAAARCLREVVQNNHNLSVSALTFLNNADLYNQWYEAVKADRRREWEISNTPHPEV